MFSFWVILISIVDISNSMLIALARPIKEALQVPVCCTLQGEDIFLDDLSEPHHSQALDLIKDGTAYVDRFLAVSDYYAEHMCRYLALPDSKVNVVPLGINVNGFEPRQRAAHKSNELVIGHFGRIAPEKGTHLVCEAFRRFRDCEKRNTASLRVAGYVGPEHRSYLQKIKDQVREWGLDGDVTFQATLDRKEKADFLRQLDLFVVPAAYDDPKGLALLEAMACGVPVVAPRRGTYTEMIERTGGGVLVPPGDIDALVRVLQELAFCSISLSPVHARLGGAAGFFLMAPSGSHR